MKRRIQTLALAAAASLAASAASALPAAFGAARSILKGDREAVPAGIAAPKFEAQSAFLSGCTPQKKTAKDFTLNDIYGRPVVLSSYRGKYVLVEFFSTRCSACREMFQYAVALSRAFKDKGVTVLSVSGEPREYLHSVFDAFMKELRKVEGADFSGYRVLADGYGVSRDYGVEYVPHFVLVGPGGEVVTEGTGGEGYMKAVEHLKKVYGDPSKKGDES